MLFNIIKKIQIFRLKLEFFTVIVASLLERK